MRSYECTIALSAELGEEQVDEQIDKVGEIISTNGGSVKQVADWGMRDLAYDIRKERRAMFRVVVFDGSGATVDELERNLRISDHVLRYMTVRIDPDRPPLDLGRSRRAGDDEDERPQQEETAPPAGEASPAAGTESAKVETGDDAGPRT